MEVLKNTFSSHPVTFYQCDEGIIVKLLHIGETWISSFKMI